MGVLETSVHPDITWKIWEDIWVYWIEKEIDIDEDGFDVRGVSTLVSNDNRV
jgi:hypothetical protein